MHGELSETSTYRASERQINRSKYLHIETFIKYAIRSRFALFTPLRALYGKNV